MSTLTDIQNLLQVNADTAERVRAGMDEAGLDYSSCTRREFNAAARMAFDTLQAVHRDMGTGVHRILNGDSL
jgi:hypothetical protein